MPRSAASTRPLINSELGFIVIADFTIPVTTWTPAMTALVPSWPSGKLSSANPMAEACHSSMERHTFGAELKNFDDFLTDFCIAVTLL